MVMVVERKKKKKQAMINILIMCQTTEHLLGHCDGKTQIQELTLVYFNTFVDELY